jgi:MYXO-CTERM domain-containing protein
MKRSVVSLFTFSLFAITGSASAADVQAQPGVQHADGYDAVRGVLFVPTEGLTLLADCPVAQGSGDNSGLGCVAGLDADVMYEPASNVDDVIAGLTTALAPYGVQVTSVRPPEYVPYQMLLPSTEENADSTSRACVGAAIDCDGVQRNDIAFTNGGTMFCTDPDPVQAALIAFGYMSGLENTDNVNDVMYYAAADPFGPDFTMPVVAFDTECGTLVETVDDMEMTNPLQCSVSVNHEPYCDDMENMASSDAELLAYYGAGPVDEDTTPPTVTAMTIPEDGSTVEALDLSATITDDQGLVFVRWTVQSDVLAGMAPADDAGRVCKGHNGVCAVDFESAPPYHQAEDNVYSTNPEFAALPGGEYTVMLEASDLAGNEIEPVMITVTVAGGAADTSGGTDASDTNAEGASNTNGDSNSDSDADSSSGGTGDGGTNQTGGDEDGDGGCSCSTEPGFGGAAGLLLGVFGFVATRRRRD